MPDHHRNKPKLTYYHAKPEPIMLVDVPTVTRACLRCRNEFTSINGARLCGDCNIKNQNAARRNDYGGTGNRHLHDQVNKK